MRKWVARWRTGEIMANSEDIFHISIFFNRKQCSKVLKEALLLFLEWKNAQVGKVSQMEQIIYANRYCSILHRILKKKSLKPSSIEEFHNS